MNDWESYWKNVEETGPNGQVFWDKPDAQDSLDDLHRILKYLRPDLPLIDMGCGNGVRTRFLAQHFKKVLGLDISSSAIQLARMVSENQGFSETNIEFRVFDALDTENARNLYSEIGDTNIYTRGVLFAIKRRDRPIFIESLKILLGKKGILYQIEIPSSSILYLRTLPDHVITQIPKITRRIGFNFEEREKYYPDEEWIVLDQGQNIILNTLRFSQGKEDAMPANYMILRRRL